MDKFVFEIRGDPQHIELCGDVSPTPGFTMDVDDAGGTSDYNALSNKPTLNGKVIQGDMQETDPTVSEWAKQAQKPIYTPDEVDAVSKDDAIPIEWLAQLF